MPSSACAGTGVCKMLPYHMSLKEKITCPVYEGRCEYRAGKIELTLPVKQFSNADREERFEGGVFQVQERFTLPRWLCKKLGVEQGFIPVGSYSVTFRSSTINITLSCFPVAAIHRQHWKVA